MIAAVGSVCHHCAAPAEMQWQRHGTQAEAAAHFTALEANILASGNPGYVQDRSGPVHVTVHGCGDHALGPIPGPERAAPVPCPDCHAAVGSPCVKPDGSTRPVEHPARAAAQPKPVRHDGAHQVDCGGYGNCRCAAKTG